MDSSTYKTSHRQTHTPKKKWHQLAFIRTLQPWRIGKLGVRVWSGTWPPRAVLLTHTCGALSLWKGTGIPSSSAPTQPTTVGLEPTNQNPTSPRSWLPRTTIDDTSTTKHLRHDHHHQHDHRPPRNPIKEDPEKDRRPDQTPRDSSPPSLSPPPGQVEGSSLR